MPEGEELFTITEADIDVKYNTERLRRQTRLERGVSLLAGGGPTMMNGQDILDPVPFDVFDVIDEGMGSNSDMLKVR